MENTSLNIIEIVGTISTELKFDHEYYGENFYTFDITTNRLSDTNDILPAIVSDRLIDVKELTVGTRISVSGQLRSYNVKENERLKLILKVFVRDITVLTEDVEDSNVIELNGYICKPTVYRQTPKGREICDVIVATNRAFGKSDYIPTICWGRNAKFAKNLEVGDNVKLTGRFQSREYSKRVAEDEYITKTAYEVSVSRIECINATTTVEEEITEPAE
jgi:single-stranded DNA-binding protein